MTKQVPDVVLHAGTKHSFVIGACLSEILRLLVKEPTQKYDRIIDSTACWRRYIAVWEIKDDHLWLVSVQGHYKKARTEPELATWFTGKATLSRYKLAKGDGHIPNQIVNVLTTFAFDSGRLVSAQSV